MVVGPTCKETQVVKDTTKDVHIERRFLKVAPREEGTGLLRRVKPSPESLEETLLSRCRLSLM